MVKNSLDDREARGCRYHSITNLQPFAAMNLRTGSVYYVSRYRFGFATFERQLLGQSYEYVNDKVLEPWKAPAQTILQIFYFRVFKSRPFVDMTEFWLAKELLALQ